MFSVACVAAAQVERPAENTPLQNTGKPMMVDYRCAEEDIRLAGLSCTIDDPCPVFLELASVEAVGNRIFAAGNIHSSTTTLSSVLLSSDDAGKTWREPYERVRLAGEQSRDRRSNRSNPGDADAQTIGHGDLS